MPGKTAGTAPGHRGGRPSGTRRRSRRSRPRTPVGRPARRRTASHDRGRPGMNTGPCPVPHRTSPRGLRRTGRATCAWGTPRRRRSTHRPRAPECSSHQHCAAPQSIRHFAMMKATFRASLGQRAFKRWGAPAPATAQFPPAGGGRGGAATPHRPHAGFSRTRRRTRARLSALTGSRVICGRSWPDVEDGHGLVVKSIPDAVGTAAG